MLPMLSTMHPATRAAIQAAHRKYFLGLPPEAPGKRATRLRMRKLRAKRAAEEGRVIVQRASLKNMTDEQKLARRREQKAKVMADLRARARALATPAGIPEFDMASIMRTLDAFATKPRVRVPAPSRPLPLH